MNNIGFKRIVMNQINSLAIQKTALETDKGFKKIPYKIKETYYNTYDVVTDYLYEILNGLERGEDVPFDKYLLLSEMYDSLENFLKEILDIYGIKYTTV